MYNTSFVCTYSTMTDEKMSQETYQNELLSALGVSNYSDEVIDKIQLVCEHLVHKQELISKLLFPELLLLFSYDYFHLTHLLLCDTFKKKDTTQSYETLLKALS